MWSLDQQYQHHLETYSKCNFQALPDLQNQTWWVETSKSSKGLVCTQKCENHWTRGSCALVHEYANINEHKLSAGERSQPSVPCPEWVPHFPLGHLCREGKEGAREHTHIYQRGRTSQLPSLISGIFSFIILKLWEKNYSLTPFTSYEVNVRNILPSWNQCLCTILWCIFIFYLC